MFNCDALSMPKECQLLGHLGAQYYERASIFPGLVGMGGARHIRVKVVLRLG